VDLRVVGRGGRNGRAYSPKAVVDVGAGLDVDVEKTGDESLSGFVDSGSSGVLDPTANCHGFL